MPQGNSRTWAPIAVVGPTKRILGSPWQPLDEEEGLLGTSVAERTFTFPGFGNASQKAPRPNPRPLRNNRQTFVPGAVANLIYGVARARVGFTKLLGASFDGGGFQNVDNPLSYTPAAPADPDEYESLLYRNRPRTQTPLPITAPPTGAILGSQNVRSTWSVLPGGLTLSVDPGRYQDAPDPLSGVNRLPGSKSLPFSAAPTPPPTSGAPRGADEGSRPTKVVQALPYSPAPTPPQVEQNARGVDEENYLATSVAERTFTFPGFGNASQKAPRPVLYPRRNNLQIFAPGAVANLIYGTARARTGYTKLLGANFDGGGFQNVDNVLGYTPEAPSDPEENEALLYARPRVYSALFAVTPPPPDLGYPPFASGARGTDEGARPTRVVQALQFSPAPTPPVLQSNRIPAEALPHLPAPVGLLSYSPAPTPPPTAAAPRGFDEGPRPEKVVQALPYSAAPTPPPTAAAPRGFDEGSRPERTVAPLPFSADPVPPTVAGNRTPAEVLQRLPLVIQPPLGVFVAPPNPPPVIATNRIPAEVLPRLGAIFQAPPTIVPPNPPPVIAIGQRSTDEGARPTTVWDWTVSYSPDPTPPPFSIAARGTDEGPRPPKVIQNLQYTVVISSNPPPVIATNRVPAEVLPHLGTIYEFAPAPTPPPFASNHTSAEELPHVGKLVVFLPYSPAPTPPPFSSGPRGFDEGSRPTTVWDWTVPYSPAPVPPPFAIGRRGFDEGGRPERVIQGPSSVPPTNAYIPELASVGASPDQRGTASGPEASVGSQSSENTGRGSGGEAGTGSQSKESTGRGSGPEAGTGSQSTENTGKGAGAENTGRGGAGEYRPAGGGPE